MTLAVAPRDYGELVSRYENLLCTGFTGGVVGQVDDLPVYRLCLRGRSPTAQHWLLAAGMHGDEPAGHIALLEFLEQDARSLSGRIDLTVLPCISPWGYIHDRREDRQGIDLNRSFERDDVESVRLYRQLLDGETFDLFLEFHEDWEFEGYYLFEVRQDGAPRLGPALIDAVRPHGPIHAHREVDGYPANGGIIDATASLLAAHEIGLRPLPLWLFGTGRCRTSITSETPSKAWTPDQRIGAHLSVARACVHRLGHRDPGHRAEGRPDQ